MTTRAEKIRVHLKTADMWAGQALGQSIAGAKPEIILATIQKAQEELELAEAAIWEEVDILDDPR